jgi:O-acetyl-ADP-ribose deacetylase
VSSAVQVAKRERFRSIAFPLIGAGTGGGRPMDVERLMLEELESAEFDGEVRLVRYGD